ncbi:MAG: 1-acyl-sn-glycerol-3-phosphate acyltransferase, partial [Polyangiaceae bacterium]|nr:1-acyl-sn-glycerol-3-phosphate acyltransferase [Polyangiaceae bacterium]
AAPEARRAFLRDRSYVPGVRLSRAEGTATRLATEDIRATDWLPGTVRAVYGVDDAEAIAQKEHVAALSQCHPGLVELHDAHAIARTQPLRVHPLTVERSAKEVVVKSAGGSSLDFGPVKQYWRDLFAIGPWPVEDLYYGLCDRFVEDVHVEDPAALEAVAGKPVLFLANHQVGIESLIFSVIASALVRTPTLTLAKVEHRETWLGKLITHCFRYPGARDPGVIAYFDRNDPKSLPGIVAELGAGISGEAKSLMVHVEGTRALSCRQTIQKMSGVFVDLAIEAGLPIVPVRFTGGLPVEPLASRLEFPLGMGRQRYHLGRPIASDELKKLPYRDRVERVKSAIDGLADASTEQPSAGDPAFEAIARAWASRTGAELEHATLFTVLTERAEPTEPVRRMLEGARAGKLSVG